MQCHWHHLFFVCLFICLFNVFYLFVCQFVDLFIHLLSFCNAMLLASSSSSIALGAARRKGQPSWSVIFMYFYNKQNYICIIIPIIFVKLYLVPKGAKANQAGQQFSCICMIFSIVFVQLAKLYLYNYSNDICTNVLGTAGRKGQPSWSSVYIGVFV